MARNKILEANLTGDSYLCLCLCHAGGAEDEDEEDQEAQEGGYEHGGRVDVDIVHAVLSLQDKC